MGVEAIAMNQRTVVVVAVVVVAVVVGIGVDGLVALHLPVVAVVGMGKEIGVVAVAGCC